MEELASHIVASPRLGGQRQTEVQDQRDLVQVVRNEGNLDRNTQVSGNPATIVGCPNREQIV